MKTAIIWNEIDKIRYTVIDGDYRKFNGMYINAIDNDLHMEEELSDLLYTKDGELLRDFITIESFADAIRDGAFLIECGFFP